MTEPIDTPTEPNTTDGEPMDGDDHNHDHNHDHPHDHPHDHDHDETEKPV